ncbi:TauD/TfdA dioxygenase family protein [Streptomyces sp. cf124]|uniref:TauD/TfdA dioxygenase family protein n=1 Tax=Streptomyces sp. cf124 TaxID=1761903 RepID=UPI003527748C
MERDTRAVTGESVGRVRHRVHDARRCPWLQRHVPRRTFGHQPAAHRDRCRCRHRPRGAVRAAWVTPAAVRKGLFVNSGFTSHIVGVSEHESRGVLDILYAHLTKPEHVVRHRWQPGDVALWDNRSTAHYANRDYGDRHRVMHRITLRGDTPVGPATAPR